MSPQQVAFAKALFERKMKNPLAIIELSSQEMDWLASCGPTGEDSVNAEAKDAFGGLGIVVQ
jgi:hypothetical protein